MSIKQSNKDFQVNYESFLGEYNSIAEKRLNLGIPPKPLSVEMTEKLIRLFDFDNNCNLNTEQQENLLNILSNCITPGVDPAAKIKADFLYEIASQKKKSNIINPAQAIFLLGTMLGGYNLVKLTHLLREASKEHCDAILKAFEEIIIVDDASFETICAEVNNKNQLAEKIMQSWAAKNWFSTKPEIPGKISAIVYKIAGEINTDDLSPATSAWSRSDIPLHALSMLQNRASNALKEINELKKLGLKIVFVSDVLGTGSSRKSAINSIVWHIGEDIPYVPNKKRAGIILATDIAPIFFNTAEDAGVLPIKTDATQLNTGDIIEILPYEEKILVSGKNIVLNFRAEPSNILDTNRCYGRINFILGNILTKKAKSFLENKNFSNQQYICEEKNNETQTLCKKQPYTLAQKIVGKAAGLKGISPGEYCEAKVSTVGSQDTTGPMTMMELVELACLKFPTDTLVLQSFCHTSAYPKKTDVEMQKILGDFFTERGSVVLRPGDGIIHPWLNSFIIPDTLGTGGDSHTRFPIGISFAAGSGLVAFAASTGIMPISMPESVLVKFKGEKKPNITIRDLVNSIPYFAKQNGLLTLDKKNKLNVFSGKIMEIEGMEDVSVLEAFEFTDASAERSCASSTFNLSEKSVENYLIGNIKLLQSMLDSGYNSKQTIEKRIQELEKWLKTPNLLRADEDAAYAGIIEIDLNNVIEPLLACPNDPDNIKTLSEIVTDNEVKIDEVFIGSCMTHLNHYKSIIRILEKTKEKSKVKLWLAPPTKQVDNWLKENGYYALLAEFGARIEPPGCSLCMGNQARAKPGTTIVSTSTRNFPNRMGDNTNVYLSSAEIAIITAILGKIPDLKTYNEYAQSQ